MVDNFKQIKSLLSFKDVGDFYFIQIFKRKKDNPDLSSHEKLIRSYSVFSLEEYDKLEDSIKSQCLSNNARAYIRLNKRNSKVIALKMASDIIDKVASNQTNSLYKVYDSVVGQYHQDKDKTWLIDVDYPAVVALDIIEWIRDKMGNNLFKAMIPTLNGFHVITKPFDIREFKIIYPTIDIHKDNPTLLYFN